MKVSFGDFEYDGEAREVRRGGRAVSLSPKAFQLLGLLIAARPRALSKQELHDALWPRTFVAHTSLPRVVTELRQALGDDTKAPRCVRTVHGFGYAFKGDEERSPAAPGRGASSLRVIWNGGQVPLAEGETLIGRSPECAICVDSHSVSRHHARITVKEGAAFIEDLGSKNGTTVGSVRIEGASALRDGDEIAVGPAVLLFSVARLGSTETERREK